MQTVMDAFTIAEQGVAATSRFHELASSDVAAAESRHTGGLWDAMAVLIEAMNCALINEDEDAREYVLSACKLLQHNVRSTDYAAGHSLKAASPLQYRGGLAAWQMRRVSLHIEVNLAEKILCDELAQLASLSLSHFMRAFKDSFGCSPHVFLTRRRLERAQGLMLTTTAPLGQIALDCGLADQSHLSRLFKRIVGESPASWRRARLHRPAEISPGLTCCKSGRHRSGMKEMHLVD